MNLYTETALTALAGVGAVAILAKAQDAYRFFREIMLRERELEDEDRDNFGSCFHSGGIVDTHLGVPDITGGGIDYYHVKNQRLAPTVQPKADFFDISATEHVDPLWAKKDCYATEKDPPLSQVIPNMGGLDGKVAYRGPNYVTDLDVAGAMKGLMHFFVDPSEAHIERALRGGGDLAWEYHFGRIAPDGSVWCAGDERKHRGEALIHSSEMVKAARFGWTFTRDSTTPGYVWASREIGV